MAAYSFLDCVGAINGPGGSINIGSGAGVSEEGIVFEPTGDKNAMTIGADGSVMHALLADMSGTLTVNLLKTSPANAQMQQMFNTQMQSSATWGRNTLTVRDVARGDSITCQEVAFSKQPTISYTKEGEINSWPLNVGRAAIILGTGTPEAA